MPYVGKKPADIIATAVDTTTGTFSGDLTVDTSTLFVDSANNNVGIGTTSPSLSTASGSAKGLEINGTVPAINLNAGSSDEFLIYGGSSNANILVANNNPLRIITGGSERMRINSSGNAGIGVVPNSSWHSTLTALQIGGNASLSAQSDVGASKQAYFSQNVFNDGDQKYISTDQASNYYQGDGKHIFQVAASGSANAVISWNTALTVDNSGNIGIGTSSIDNLLHLSGASGTTTMKFTRSNTASTGNDFGRLKFENSAGTTLASIAAFSENGNTQAGLKFNTGTDSSTVLIDENGNVGIGTTAPLSLSGTADPGLTIKSNAPYILLQDANNANTIRYIANNSGEFNMGVVNDDGSSNKTEQFTLNSSGKCVMTGLAGSDYVLKVHSDRNNNDGYGIVTQVGTDDPSGTHYHIVFTDGDGDTQGSITSDSGTVTYGAFTAHHPCIIPDADNDADSANNAYPYGTLLEITSLSYIQKNGADTERGILYNVQKSSSAKSKAVLGAYGSSMNGFHENNNLHQALILGDGHILCNNENGNIAIGDYICTSSTSGEGMKATSICTTIGIAREAITFSNSTAVLVAVEYGYRQFIPEELEARITTLEGA